MLSELRLFQLISPSLPVGAFTYSQGLEWAIEAGWVRDQTGLEHWLRGVLEHSVMTLEVPLLLRLYRAFAEGDEAAASHWCSLLIASRETAELRAEERQRGQALLRLLPNLQIQLPPGMEAACGSSQLAGMALAAQRWGIAPDSLARGYLWSWLENAVMAGVKLIPLGQTAGQQLLLELAAELPPLLQRAAAMDDDAIGSSTPALAIASSRHETQYSRLFRS